MCFSGCCPPVCFSPFPVVAVVAVISTFCFLLLSDCEELGERTKRLEKQDLKLIQLIFLYQQFCEIPECGNYQQTVGAVETVSLFELCTLNKNKSEPDNKEKETKLGPRW